MSNPLNSGGLNKRCTEMEGRVLFERILIVDEQTLPLGIGLQNDFLVKPSLKEPQDA